MDKKILIRKIIAEEVSRLIDEDYESVQEIKTLASEVLVFFAEQNIDRVLQFANDIKSIGYFNTITISNAVENSEKYNKLQSFIIETKISFMFLPKSNHISGHYTLIGGQIGKDYDPREYRDIVIYYDENFLSELQKKINDHLNKEWKFESKDLYTLLYFKFLSSLIHEIQHAYDDYRSKGKMYDTKEFRKYIEKYSKKKEFIDKKEELAATKTYLNFPHEVWARFAQAIEKTNFTSGDFMEASDGRFYMKYEMKPIRSVLIKFYYNFIGWTSLFKDNNELSDMQRRLQKAVVQFWHKEQERIKEENKNPKYFT